MSVNIAMGIIAVGMPLAFLLADTFPFHFAGVPAYAKVPVHQRIRRK